MKLVFFPAPADFRNWLEQHHTKAQELWVISAKKEETRLKRLDRLIQDSAHARTIPPLTRPTRSRKGPSS